jgi:chemotaxis protein CheD
MDPTPLTTALELRVETAPAQAYLHPGQVFASGEPTLVTTVLGSCVAVCLWDPSTGVGGINHFQLPQWSGKGPRTPRFASVAIQALLDRLLALGARRSEIRAKVFGGACVTAGSLGHRKSLGEQNVEHALVYLRECSLPVAATATGGPRGRKLVFHTSDGSAWVKEL